MSKPDEELTFEEYWERYSCATDTPKQAARAAWLLAIKQERRLQLLRPTPRAADGLVRCQKCNALIETTVHCDNCGTFEPTRR